MRTVKPLPLPSSPAVTTSIELGRWIRAARTHTGLSMTDAALNLGVARQTMQTIETAPGTVNLETVLHVARQLGLEITLALPGSKPEPER